MKSLENGESALLTARRRSDNSKLDVDSRKKAHRAQKRIIQPSDGENSVLYDPQGVIANKAYEEQGKLRCAKS